MKLNGDMSNILKEKSKIKGRWEAKGDGSLWNGAEVVSPILYDNPNDIKEIYTIANAMKGMLFSTSDRCGGHVHIGANYLKSVEDMKELLEIWGNAEEVFYLISNQAGELPRRGTEQYAIPMSSKIQGSDLEEKKEQNKDIFIVDAQRIQDSRYSAINLMNIGNNKNTIEFRLSNGTLDPNVWIENIRLYGRTVQMAHEISRVNNKMRRGEPITKEEEDKLRFKSNLKKDISRDEKMENLMGLLFDEEERDVYENRYVANKELEEKEHVLGNMRFGKVDFKDIYESVEIPSDIIKNLSETDKNQVIDRKEGEDGR